MYYFLIEDNFDIDVIGGKGFVMMHGIFTVGNEDDFE
jgi:hypothetical protein